MKRDTSQPVHVAESTFNGWKTIELTNGLAAVHVAPEIGGRIIQFTAGNHGFFWYNEELRGAIPSLVAEMRTEDRDGAEWRNYGGEKIWLAPQAWKHGAYNDYCRYRKLPLTDRNPGPPMPELDGAPHRVETGGTGMTLQSGESVQFGVSVARNIRMNPDAAGVRIHATMKNVDTRDRSWGIWSVAQLDASLPDGSANTSIRTYCPINANSIFHKGYEVFFGLVGTPQVRPDYESGIMTTQYLDEVGKIGLDSDGGWVATVDGSSGYAFIQKFPYFPGRRYPDNASVEIWFHGEGACYAYDRKMILGPEEPHLIESEILGPLESLKPGESASFDYEMYGTCIGGDFPVLECAEAGVICTALCAREDRQNDIGLSGRIGVFYAGTVHVSFLTERGRIIGQSEQFVGASPLKPLVLEESTIHVIRNVPENTDVISVELRSRSRADFMPLGRVRIEWKGT